MKQEKCKKKELNTSQRMVIGISRMMEEERRLQLTWCCRPEQRCLKTKSTDLKTQLQSVAFGEVPHHYEVFSGTL